VTKINKKELISEIFRLLREGKTYREIASILKISKSLVGKLIKEANEISTIVTGDSSSEQFSNKEKWTKLFPKYTKKRLNGVSRVKATTSLGLNPETESAFNTYLLKLQKDELLPLFQLLNIVFNRADLSLTDAFQMLVKRYKKNMYNCRQKNIELEYQIAELEDASVEAEKWMQMCIGSKAAYLEFVVRVLKYVNEIDVRKTRQGNSISLDSVCALVTKLRKEGAREIQRANEEGWIPVIGRVVDVVVEVKRSHDQMKAFLR
jgi:hypothetical protein